MSNDPYTLRRLQMAYLQVKLSRHEKIDSKDKCTYCWNPIRSCEDTCKTTKNTYQDRKKDMFLSG